jgi:class 3 adenylate cyclase
VSLLTDLFNKFDALTYKYGVYKVETIGPRLLARLSDPTPPPGLFLGDCYHCATGAVEEDARHADAMLRFASEMIDVITSFDLSPYVENAPPLRMRIGLHSGTTLGGVMQQL